MVGATGASRGARSVVAVHEVAAVVAVASGGVAGVEPRDRTRAARGSADGGRDQAAFDALAARRLDGVTLHAPANSDALLAELLVERDIGRRHLATVTESFYDQDWRRVHRGDGVHAEDHLWWATAAFLELDDAIKRLRR